MVYHLFDVLPLTFEQISVLCSDYTKFECSNSERGRNLILWKFTMQYSIVKRVLGHVDYSTDTVKPCF